MRGEGARPQRAHHPFSPGRLAPNRSPTPQKSTTKLSAIRFGITVTKEGSKTTASYHFIESIARDDDKSNEENWNAMVEKLSDDEGCFVVFDMRFEHSGRTLYRPLLVSWAPDTLGITAKMMIGSNKESVKTELEGVQKSLHASDKDELTYAEAKSATL